MAKSMIHLTVMVGSPQDVAPEREQLEEIVRELNLAWSRDLGIYLDLLKWETSGYPAIGSDPQDVVNEQLGDNYDIFIGILWHRFGTPTPRAQSGTLEEFNRAHERYLKDPNSVKIMFYFKNAPVPPTEIDPSQFTQVMDFKKSLGGEGVLYWVFNDAQTFGSLLRIHLARQVQGWQSSTRPRSNERSEENPPPEALPSSGDTSVEGDEFEEEGALDALERGNEGSEILTQILERISRTILDLGNNMKSRTHDLSSLEDGASKLRAAKSISHQAASDLEQFATVMGAEIDLFEIRQRSTLDAWLKVIELQKDFSKEESGSFLEMIKKVKMTMIETRGQMSVMRNTIASLPRITTAFNRGKRLAVSALDRFDKQLLDGITLLDEIDSQDSPSDRAM